MNKLKVVTIIGIILDIIVFIVSINAFCIIAVINYEILLKDKDYKSLINVITSDNCSDLDILYLLLVIPAVIIFILCMLIALYNSIIAILKIIKDIKILILSKKSNWDTIIKQSKSKLLPVMITLNIALISIDLIRLWVIKKETGIQVI